MLEKTGIAFFDSIGGFPRPSAVAIVGPLGTGKSTLMKELVVKAIANENYVLYYCMDEPANAVRQSLSGLGLGVEKAEKEGRLSFIDIFELGVKKLATDFTNTSPEKITDSVLKFSDLAKMGQDFTMNNLNKKQFVVMDSLTQMFVVSEPKAVFQYCQILKYATRFANAIGVASLHTKVLPETIENAFLNLADGIIELSKKSTDRMSFSRNGILRVLRMGSQEVNPAGHYYELTKAGFAISPIAEVS